MKRSSPIWLLAAACLAAACGSLPTTRYYLMAPPFAGTGATPAEARGAGLRLGVETFIVDPPYDQSRLVYRIGRDSGEVGFYQHHRWAAPPGRLIATALASGLRGLPVVDVEPATASGRYDLVLTGRVLSLEEVDLPVSQLARLQLDLKLYHLADDSLVWSRLLTAEAAGNADNASDIMRQMQSAFEQLLGQLRAELEPVFQRLAAHGG